MDLSTTEAIIFDFGGVLINLDYQRTIDAFKQMGIEDFSDLYSQAAQSALFDDLETGRISPQRFINGLLDFLPPGTSANSVVAAWNAMILDVPQYAIETLLALRNRGMRVYLLSNTNEIHIDKAIRAWNSTAPEHPLTSLFDRVYLSHEMGMRKPNPEIFRTVCSNHNLLPERTLFIDDSIQHIQGAASIGLKTYHLQAPTTVQTLFS